MFKKITLLFLIIILASCTEMDSYHNDSWDRYHKKTSTSDKLHSKLVEVHNRDSLAFKYSPTRADFRDTLYS